MSNANGNVGNVTPAKGKVMIKPVCWIGMYQKLVWALYAGGLDEQMYIYFKLFSV